MGTMPSVGQSPGRDEACRLKAKAQLDTVLFAPRYGSSTCCEMLSCSVCVLLNRRPSMCPFTTIDQLSLPQHTQTRFHAISLSLFLSCSYTQTHTLTEKTLTEQTQAFFYTIVYTVNNIISSKQSNRIIPSLLSYWHISVRCTYIQTHSHTCRERERYNIQYNTSHLIS